MGDIKITNHQLFSLVAVFAMGGTIILISSLLTSIAKQDAWITALLAPILSLPVMWMFWYIGNQNPGMTLVGIIKRVFGKWLGFPVSIMLVAYYLDLACRLPWYAGNFVTTEAMPETPAYVINALFVICVVIAIIYGVETIARASEIFLYFASVMMLLALIMVMPNAKIQNIQPVLEKGFIPVLKGLVFIMSYLTFSLITIMMIYPVNIINTVNAKKPIFTGILWAGFLVFLTVFMSILVLGGALNPTLQHPTYLLAKEINIGVIFSRFEFIIAAVWIITMFIVNVLFFYAGVTGLAELLGLKDYKRIVIPIGFITLIMSEVVFPNSIYQANWQTLVHTPYSFTFGFVLPFLLLITIWIKNMIFKQKRCVKSR